ncbi:hypothetical protein, unlikely [Trypanosoma brucei gambiense DAL972]|uniref:Uncharacterized protein n=1 Tax=Trypanosoma brucei gambiense (strain MHOM/CI/86/DAL972) TaxID=679716 RepID=C9ZVZ9_TRYB9|nr:hypothetical protein, unlikely [Trypanosoma brucei gambiense DAL972]CBH13587.1 hypothetical protein, unlikely [Trypanosoma brucei gambiense DAL972]|eukprot:XP_011775864.1 hypothetical protein, unlikely [Trypanosoma brucei gambiense DAL972]
MARTPQPSIRAYTGSGNRLWAEGSKAATPHSQSRTFHQMWPTPPSFPFRSHSLTDATLPAFLVLFLHSTLFFSSHLGKFADRKGKAMTHQKEKKGRYRSYV